MLTWWQRWTNIRFYVVYRVRSFISFMQNLFPFLWDENHCFNNVLKKKNFGLSVHCMIGTQCRWSTWTWRTTRSLAGPRTRRRTATATASRSPAAASAAPPSLGTEPTCLSFLHLFVNQYSPYQKRIPITDSIRIQKQWKRHKLPRI